MGVPRTVLDIRALGWDIRPSSLFCFVEGRHNGSTLPLPIVMVFVLLAVLARYAYGDLSGGALFQIFMPVLAAMWGM